jgi:hypothetical protein
MTSADIENIIRADIDIIITLSMFKCIEVKRLLKRFVSTCDRKSVS